MVAGLTKPGTFGWSEEDCFPLGEMGLAESVLTVALLFLSTHLDSHGSHQPGTLIAEYRSKPFTFLPDAVFVVSKSNDATLGADREAFFVLCYHLDPHGREDLESTVFGMVFFNSDD